MTKKNELYEKVSSDDTYKRILEAAPEEMREHIDSVVKAYLDKIKDDVLDPLEMISKDPKFAKALRDELLKNGENLTLGSTMKKG